MTQDTTTCKNRQQWRVAIVGGAISAAGGGSPRSIARQAHGLHLVGCDVSIYGGFNRRFPLTIDDFHLGDIPVIATPLWGPNNLGFAPKMFLKLAKAMPQIDVVHLNGAWNLTTFICAAICRWHKVPYIISCRGHFGEYHFSRFRGIKPLLFHTMEKCNIVGATAMHTTADWESNTSARALRYARRVVTIPNAVDLEDFTPRRSRSDARETLNIPEGNIALICFGRMAHQKNPHFLVKTLAEAISREPKAGERTILYFVGPPEPRLKRELIKQIQQLGIEKHVVFVDYAAGRDRQDWLSAANVFVLPSFDENFCIAAVEAAACGTFCLLSDRVGVAEQLPPTQTQILPLDHQEWVNALVELLRNPPRQQSVGEDLLIRFSPRGVAKQWQDFYTTLN